MPSNSRYRPVSCLNRIVLPLTNGALYQSALRLVTIQLVTHGK